jgi:hypothetical protein
MGIVRKEEILGVCTRAGVVSCSGCMEAGEWDNLLEEEIIDFEEVDGILSFCDRCKRRFT